MGGWGRGAAEREKTTALSKWRKISWLSFQFLIVVLAKSKCALFESLRICVASLK